MKKIAKTREDASRMSQIKANKINDLQSRISYEQNSQEELQKRLENAKEQREARQAQKLKRAYDEMVAFENERKKERERKEQAKAEA